MLTVLQDVCQVRAYTLQTQESYSLMGYLLHDFEIGISHVVSTFYILGTVLSMSWIFIHIILITTLVRCTNHSHYTGEKAKSQKVSDEPSCHSL